MIQKYSDRKVTRYPGQRPCQTARNAIVMRWDASLLPNHFNCLKTYLEGYTAAVHTHTVSMSLHNN